MADRDDLQGGWIGASDWRVDTRAVQGRPTAFRRDFLLSEPPQSATLLIAAAHRYALWVNGELVFDEHSYHHIILEMESVPFPLKQGLNTVLMKLDRDGCAARVDLKEGTPASEGVRVVTDKRGAILEVIGISPEPVDIELVIRERSTRGRIQPNATYEVGNEGLVQIRAAPFDYPYQPPG